MPVVVAVSTARISPCQCRLLYKIWSAFVAQFVCKGRYSFCMQKNYAVELPGVESRFNFIHIWFYGSYHSVLSSKEQKSTVV